VHLVFEVDIKELHAAYCFVYYPFKTVTNKSSREMNLYITVL